jgi:hypothetical protein
MAARILLASGSALVAASAMPLLFIGAEALLQGDTIATVGRRLALAAALCSAVPVALLLPISDDFPWKAGAVGCTTLLIWAAAYHLGAAIFTGPHSIRSNPSG